LAAEVKEMLPVRLDRKEKKMRLKWIATTVAAGVLAVSGGAQQTTPAPDNTKVNQRDRSKTEPTADQAKNNVNDREIMQKIRRAVMDEKSLSTYAHNVKIVSQNGKVTLKGPVRSEEEKATIAQKATEVAGAGNVTNDITIKPAK
jgi:osmotically-inducible protein OsmY